MLFQLPRACRTFTVVNPAAQWGWNEVFLNKMAYYLEMLVWTKTKDAQKKIPQERPKPFIPDFMGGPSEVNKDVEVHTSDDIKSILSMPRAAA